MSTATAWFLKSLALMDGTHLGYAKRVPAPVRKQREGGYVFRYEQQSLEQAIVQKLARIVSGLRASHLTLEGGFFQEAAILQRTVDEAQEDVLFLAYGRLTGQWRGIHEKYLENFWQDEPVSKVAVRRPEIRDYLAEIEGSLTQRDARAALKPIKDLYGVYSGYAHCASAHVMEMVAGDPPAFKLNGSPRSQFYSDQIYDIRNQHYRGLVAFAVTSLLFDDPTHFRQLMAFADEFIKTTDQVPDP
jgi:hypothetical protein